MINCNIAKDLIPIYVEELTNEDSTSFVEQHITECSQCRNYYEMIKQDYEKHRQQQPDKQRLDDLVAKLAKYQQNIKLVGVLVAMLMSCIITGGGVQFLSTIPFLILTPFVCRLYYNKSIPIVLSSILFGVIGGMLSEENASFIPFFTIIAFLTACLGVWAGVLVKNGIKQVKAGLKIMHMLLAMVILLFSGLAYFSFWGNPLGYLETMIKTREYVNETYEQGTLTFKGVSYNFKDHRHYGRFEYVLNETRQLASIGFSVNGEVNDDYRYRLTMQFAEERSADLKTEIAAAVGFTPVTILAKPEAELYITQDEINSRYYHLSYDLEKRKKATLRRESESGKLRYEISFGAFSGEYDRLGKDELLAKSTIILNTLKERNLPFSKIEIKAMDFNGSLQSVSFNQNTTVQELINSYQRYE